MSTSSTSNAIFSGASTYSQDFQNLISRAAAIASLPITQLNSDKTSLTNQSTEISTLDTKFQAVQKALQGITKALSGTSYQAEVSDDKKLSVTLSDGAVEGSYLVDVVDPGTYAKSLTPSNWITGTGAARSYWLTLGSSKYAISPKSNSASDVVAAINANYGDKVRATVVNVGGSTADYRISLQSVALGDLKPGLLTGPAAPVSKQTQQVHGSNTLAASHTGQAWSDDSAQTFQLSLGGQLHSLSPGDNSALSVANAINENFGSQVAATATNEGSEESPDWRITLTAIGPGNLNPDILSSTGGGEPVGLQTQTATGSDTVATSKTTSNWVTDTGSPLTWQLSLGGVKYNLSPSANTAQALVADIQNKYNDKVQALLVDNVNGGVHTYQISLTAVNPGDLQPDLIASQVDLAQQQIPPGAAAQYIVNNSGKVVQSGTRSVSIATGVTAHLLAKDDGTPVSVTVTRPTSALSDAMKTFTDAYNAAVDELDKQHGNTKGALAGDSLVSSLSGALSDMANYTSGGGDVDNLALLGVELDKTGHLSYDSTKLIIADMMGSSGVTSFLGSVTSGFLKSATDALKAIENPTSGLIATAKAGVAAQITSIDSNIADIQARVDRMTQQMQQQMAAADALIASMQQQYGYMASMFSAMQSAADQYK